jgi:hypothetical protein
MHNKKGRIYIDVTGFVQQLAVVALRNNNNNKKVDNKRE